MPVTKTDNSFLSDKVEMRILHSPWKDGKTLNVLDVFAGRGAVWGAVERKSGRVISRIAIEKREDMYDFHIHGDNVCALSGMDLDMFDVIDIDAYGVPFNHLEILRKNKYRGCVFATFIQVLHGIIPNGLLLELGFPSAVHEKAPTLPGRRGWEIFKEYLALIGVKRIIHRSHARKHYLFFRIGETEEHEGGCGSHQEGTFEGLS